MDSELKKICTEEEHRLLRQDGYFCFEDIEKGRRPEDLEDIREIEIQRIAGVLKLHPIQPQPKRKKRIQCCDVYYLGNSYGLKHIFGRFLPPPSYCTNGEFIAACIAAGFIVVPIPKSRNAAIYVKCDRKTGYDGYYICVRAKSC